jgi:hypothetical protein
MNQTDLINYERRSIAIAKYEQQVRESAGFIKEAIDRLLHPRHHFKPLLVL